MANASHVGAHSQQVGVVAPEVGVGGAPAAVVLQQQPQAVQAVTGALPMPIWCSQQAARQELAPRKGCLKAVLFACVRQSMLQD